MLGRALYSCRMDVGVTELRAHLSDWLRRARDGDEIGVTERGLPVARLVGIDSAGALERLTAEGVIARPQSDERPSASGQARPRSRRPVSDRVGELRR